MMEKRSSGLSCRAAICGIVVLLSATAFSCSLAAEFHKVKDKDMKLDGSLCSLPKSSAFELGVAAIASLFVAQLVGTTAAATTMCAAKPKKNSTSKGRVASVALLILSWVSFAVAVILLAAAASMNHGQRYGRGWMDGDCYVAKNGVFGGAAALVVLTALLILGLTFATKPAAAADMVAAPTSGATCTRARLDAATADAEQAGGRSKQ
ncbi:protein MODIFYING WALL LIGNIN-1-like [Phragmites australis]|uniref:protein MODIFYING WALL LIGNIN-1-like n=1 Tax=Phragmites australis TaxID=29695 RepID=UPI002D7A01AA|nr:protein MODIFYING WALL LIGNIN-1-like [Phragmites australis]